MSRRGVRSARVAHPSHRPDLTFGGVAIADICGKLRAWHDQYPDPSGQADQNAVARAAEDERLSRFAGLQVLDRDQVAELVRWKFQSMPHREALAMKGISPQRWHARDGAPGVADLIRIALATDDDYDALATMAARGSGIDHFGPAMSSVVLAACRPTRYTIADSRALHALRALGLLPQGQPSFRLDNWVPYLTACRNLASQCSLTSRQVDRALWIAASDPDSQPTAGT